jgi:squamous cell carcinoma antigen recognized by T-cells 3
MDTLADVASMQNHQPMRSTPPLNSNSSAESISSIRRPSLTSHPRASFDIAMMETPRQLLRGDYTGTSLPLENQQRLAELVGQVQETPSTYDAHMEIIKLLHQGFVDHIYPSSNPNARRDPHSYDLLAELRQARESADKIFALGEEQWLDWLQDGSILAQSAEDRVDVVEKCRRAVEEEYGSAQLWVTYGDWVHHCYKWAQDSNAVTSTGLPDEERLVGRELFPWANVNQVWDQAIEQTRFNMSQSHLVWNKFMSVRFPQFEEKLSQESAAQVLDLFQQRLQTPHAEWDSTFQAFSSFVSANFSNEVYEEIMATTNQAAGPVKAIWVTREQFESGIADAAETGDRYAEYQAFGSYLQWEKEQHEQSRRQRVKGKRKDQLDDVDHGAAMVAAIFQRAELRIPADVTLWEEHARYLLQKQLPGLPGLLSRATRHCPWSGSLWKQYLLTSEIADEPHQTIENIKHDATKTGMLDAGGIEEVLKVYDAWCGYLLRKTRRVGSTEEDSDVAEMGIRTSMEAVQSLASKLELPDSFDASFRLQRKYVEYLKSQGRLDNARKQFDDAITVYGAHYRFWLRFYDFELQKSLHINSLQENSRDGISLNASTPFAVAILKQGLERKDLDYPEYLIEALLNHCEDYEDAEELQAALFIVGQVQAQVATRRQQEAAEQATEAATNLTAKAVAEERAEKVATKLHIGKRKREDDEEIDDAKRSRVDQSTQSTVEQPSTTDEPKRDREHASILVQHVPDDVSETRVRQYFTTCGTVKSIRMLSDEDHSFVVEFENTDEARYALSKDSQTFDEAIISVVLNTESTLYVTNYPAAADDGYIRKLFSPYGEIISIRFPSLQGNKRRRFCYVEFKASEQAQAALELDGQEQEGLPLLVKVSNPSVKKQRDEQKTDGRTIFVGQLPFKATEDQVKAAFSTYGDIESMKMPHDPNTKSRNKGIAFLVFSSSDAANAALKMNGQEFQGRKIKVNLTQSQGSRRGRASHSERSKSPSVSVNGDATSPSAGVSVSDLEDRRQRTIALSGVPDTVNEARIRAIAEGVGPLRKVILKTNHQGALIEFDTVADAGKAAIELDGYEITPARQVQVTSQKRMLSQQAEKKEERIGKPGSLLTGGAPPKRPAQQVGRRGGHLGQRSAAIFRQTNGETAEGTKKTNDDFRAMLGKS